MSNYQKSQKHFASTDLYPPLLGQDCSSTFFDCDNIVQNSLLWGSDFDGPSDPVKFQSSLLDYPIESDKLKDQVYDHYHPAFDTALEQSFECPHTPMTSPYKGSIPSDSFRVNFVPPNSNYTSEHFNDHRLSKHSKRTIYSSPGDCRVKAATSSGKFESFNSESTSNLEIHDNLSSVSYHPDMQSKKVGRVSFMIKSGKVTASASPDHNSKMENLQMNNVQPSCKKRLDFDATMDNEPPHEDTSNIVQLTPSITVRTRKDMVDCSSYRNSINRSKMKQSLNQSSNCIQPLAKRTNQPFKLTTAIQTKENHCISPLKKYMNKENEENINTPFTEVKQSSRVLRKFSNPMLIAENSSSTPRDSTNLPATALLETPSIFDEEATEEAYQVSKRQRSLDPETLEYEKFVLGVLKEEPAEDDEEEDDVYMDDGIFTERDSTIRIPEKELEELLEDYNNFRAEETKHLQNRNNQNLPNGPGNKRGATTEPAPKSNVSLLMPTRMIDCFSLNQLEILQFQMNSHFQLFVQLFALSNEILGAEMIAKTALDYLFFLKCRYESVISSIGDASIYGSFDSSIANILQATFDNLPSKSAPNFLSHTETPERSPFIFTRSLGSVNDIFPFNKSTMFDISGLQKVSFFKQAYERLVMKFTQSSSSSSRLPIPADPSVKLSPLYSAPHSTPNMANLSTPSPSYCQEQHILQSPDWLSSVSPSPTSFGTLDEKVGSSHSSIPFRFKYMHTGGISLDHPTSPSDYTLPRSVLNIAEFFKLEFDQNLSIQLSSECHQLRVKFVDAEDRLLLRGIRKFGVANWSLIRQNYLPAKSEHQIRTRYKNLTSRTAPSNPIKTFYFEQFLPLSEAEESLLLKGIQKHKENFTAISREFLPSRPAAYLKRFWIDKKDKRVSLGVF